ncbi:MAG: hypothetical protein ACR2NP_20025 [Pirellulaceae bacterium]
MGRRDLPLLDHETLARVKPALLELRQALEYARQTNVDHWQFAVTMERLSEQGVSESDLRMLSSTGLIEFADEISAASQRRAYMPTPHLKFNGQSCFVLSGQGLEKMQKMQLRYPVTVNGNLFVPVWNPRRHELSFCGQLIKKFKWRARNQEAVLHALQSRGWPDQIDDPLEIDYRVDAKRRLHDTIKCLNRGHARPLIRFHGDGTGRGVIWRTMPVANPVQPIDASSQSQVRIS